MAIIAARKGYCVGIRTLISSWDKAASGNICLTLLHCLCWWTSERGVVLYELIGTYSVNRLVMLTR